jgi:hypothetical protein
MNLLHISSNFIETGENEFTNRLVQIQNRKQTQIQIQMNLLQISSLK